MKNQEFLDLLGEVNEGYVLAADENTARPRFRWQPWAAAAACVALICAAAWPRFAPGSFNGGRASADCALPMGDEIGDAATEEPAAPQEPAGTLVQAPGLHEYTLIERELRVITTQGDAKAPAAGANDAAQEPGLDSGPVPAPNAPAPNGGAADAPAADIPYDPENGTIFPYVEEAVIDQDEATRQYQSLLKNGGIGYGGEGYYPEWFGGAWLDNDWPDNVSRLTVAMVEGWRTEAMENTVRGWCGGTGDVLFCTAKYSYAYLKGLMDEISALFDQYGWLPSTFAANETANRIELDIFAMPSDELLADLARLDPDGDAIRVQVFTDRTIQFTADDAMKPPAPAGQPAADPADPEARAIPAVENDSGHEPMPIDESATGAVEELPEANQPAVIYGADQ